MSGALGRSALSTTTSVLAGLLAAAAFLAATAGSAAAQAPSPSPPATAGPEISTAGAAAASASPAATAAPIDAGASPEGTWVVTGFDAWGSGLTPPRPGSRLTVSLLRAGRLEGETSCGTYVGGYTVDGERIRIGVVSRGVEPCGRRAEDEAFDLTQALGLATTWAASASGLDLLDDGGAVRIALVAPGAAAAGLTGDWLVGRLAGPAGDLVVPLEGMAVSVSFGPDGRAAGSTGCRTFEAGYTAEADRVVIAPVAAVGLPCEGELRRQDRRVLGLLDEVVEWRRDGERLILSDGSGNVLLEATVPASPVAPSPAPSAAPSTSSMAPPIGDGVPSAPPGS